MTEDRFAEIEIKLFYQEETVRELNNIVCEQQRRIDQLEKGIKALAGRFKDVVEEVGGKIPNEKPPHY
jgi:SlyX protein